MTGSRPQRRRQRPATGSAAGAWSTCRAACRCPRPLRPSFSPSSLTLAPGRLHPPRPVHCDVLRHPRPPRPPSPIPPLRSSWLARLRAASGTCAGSFDGLVATAPCRQPTCCGADFASPPSPPVPACAAACAACTARTAGLATCQPCLCPEPLRRQQRSMTVGCAGPPAWWAN